MRVTCFNMFKRLYSAINIRFSDAHCYDIVSFFVCATICWRIYVANVYAILARAELSIVVFRRLFRLEARRAI